MEIGRRDCLKLGVLAGTAVALGGCSQAVRRFASKDLPEDVSLPSLKTSPTTRLLNRAGFGPTPGEVRRVADMGREAYVEEQLGVDLDDDLALAFQLSRLDVLRVDAAEIKDLPMARVIEQLQAASILGAVYSKRQLKERMVDFWSNHFNIYARKGDSAFRKGVDQVKVIREHALGKFPDMLRASAKSSAMLAYLDNEQNRKGWPNENYARELMELHTLGVHGGYAQKDVQEVARCLSGWTIETRFMRPKEKFRFDPEQHDLGEKTVLGHRIAPGGGVEDGEKVLDILVNHPSTALFIATKLSRYFLGDEVGEWPKKLAAIYTKTGGDIPAMVKPLLLSEDLLNSPPILKRPFDYMVSALRTVNAATDGSIRLQEHLEKMGQPLFQWPMPDGYPDKTAAWSGSLLARWNFAVALTQNGIPSTRADVEALVKRAGGAKGKAVCEMALSEPFGEVKSSRQIERYLRKTADVKGAFALALASYEFQWR